ncbi:hypothetical protein SAMN04490244_104375 [Tranquillimonas rosea]|uniref:Uncharacterized protein n=1 Tax=Tranquillimonas rosea TaxID=641238 RepID=A0A1H9TUI5_9RHOB|nr:hypothetical protein [Tranquillimonas rosea]SES00607.1 hypothetical protein SAMN04490244_104375 [Tranquillimonas rosea]
MRHASLDDFLRAPRARTVRGPVALIFAEDPVEIDSTVRHHAAIGFAAILLFAPPAFDLPRPLEENVHRIDHDTTTPGSVEHAVATVSDALPGLWMYYCYNAEYLFHPFAENRSVGEMLAFHAEERRDAMLTYVIDLYAGDLAAAPDAVSLEDAYLDRSGYYALARPDPATPGHPAERQLDFFGGLRWRFEEHIPRRKRKIDRIGLFRTRRGLRLGSDHTFNEPEYNTYSCPWHHNLTAAICSFRTAKALRLNPGSRAAAHRFTWHNSVPFEWRSQQLMDLGLMEPGQWF